MRDSDHERLVSTLIATARAHHAATGGVNPQWAAWYAENMASDVSRILGKELPPVELAEWLAQADRRYEVEQPDVSWPTAYATWLLETRDVE